MASLKDIAKVAGVSDRTVSAILNNRGGNVRVSQTTRERILDIAAHLNYTPNTMAQGLRCGKSFLLGFLTSQVTVSFIPEVIQGVENVLLENNYSMLLNTYRHNNDLIRKIDSMRRKKVDAIIVLADNNPDNINILKQLLKDIPLVFIGHANEEFNTPCVHCDCEMIMRSAMEHLLSLGHRKIAYLQGPCSERLNTFHNVLTEKCIARNEQIVFPDCYDFESGMEAFERYLQRRNVPTAVVAYSDLVAAGFIAGATKHGVKIPQEISVIGIDDIPLAKMISPSLTSISQPKIEQGEQAAALALKMIGGKKLLRKDSIIMASELIVRNSTANLND